jgi:Zn finger protein HypA/HybF involved in hydrogenase expression
MLGVLAVVLILIGGYVLSLYLNPYVTCTKCRGKSRLGGWIFSSSRHYCPKCKGTGLQVRLGRRLLPLKSRMPPSS